MVEIEINTIKRTAKQMNIEPVSLEDHIKKLLKSGKELSLTDIMLCFYKKPCRCIFPGISDGRTATELHAQRGSVIISEEEVILFVNHTDEYLIGPANGEDLDIECEKPTTMYQHGTTIIRRGIKKRQVTYYLDEGFIRDDIVNKKKIWNRWGPYDFEGRILKCYEQACIMGTRAGQQLPRYETPAQTEII